MLGFEKDGIRWQYTGMIVQSGGVLYQAVTGSKSPVHKIELRYVPVSDIVIPSESIVTVGQHIVETKW
jgi:hypothetical protein